jgi:hypothetical protein
MKTELSKTSSNEYEQCSDDQDNSDEWDVSEFDEPSTRSASASPFKFNNSVSKAGQATFRDFPGTGQN